MRGRLQSSSNNSDRVRARRQVAQDATGWSVQYWTRSARCPSVSGDATIDVRGKRYPPRALLAEVVPVRTRRMLGTSDVPVST
jgi:hypothetical protein